MIIEDDADIRESFGDILKDEGYSVALASNGQEALKLLGTGILPRLFLVDMMMPVMDGAAFCKAWQANPEFHSVPLFIVSASAMTLERSNACGATGFLVKPLGLNQLLDVVEKHVGKGDI